MVNFLVWIIVGGIIGWVASSLMGRREGLLLNIVVGIVGAFVAGIVLTPYFGISTINQNNFGRQSLQPPESVSLRVFHSSLCPADSVVRRAAQLNNRK
jgi:uncharacterized membrane protein YeaQ/YmgE (transglycosylase-associated protein family)